MFVQQLKYYIHRDRKMVELRGAFLAQVAGTKQVRCHIEQLMNL